MRFTKIRVENFRTIELCDLELGPGLNILYGPNDHGKSTLAHAMRTALLLPYSSSEASELVPWAGDHTPMVALTFQDDSGRHYKVRKTFGSGTRGTATLHWSNDGSDWVQEKSNKEVQPRLGEILGWGIPAQDGRGGPRGLPPSFLATAFLAEQTKVEAILEQSLEQDRDDSGRLKLSTALKALAQDPQLRLALDAAQMETDKYFGAKGSRKTGAKSPFAAARTKINALEAEVHALREAIARSAQVEQALQNLRAEREVLQERCHEALEARADVARRRDQTVAIAKAEETVAGARSVVEGIQYRRRCVEEKEEALARLDAGVGRLDSELYAAREAATAAGEELRFAEEALRAISGDQVALKHELRRAELEKELATLASARATAQSRLDLAEAALQKAREVTAAEQHLAFSEQSLAGKRDARAASKAALQERVLQRQALVDIADFGRIEEARAAVARAEADVQELRSAAARAEALRAEAAAALEKATARRLPDQSKVEALAKLEREVERAGAALGGGVLVVLQPKKDLTIEGWVDGKAVEPRSGISAARFDASRSVELRIADLVDLEVVAGDAAARATLAALQERWRTEAAPVLQAAGCADADALRAARAELDAALRWAAEKQLEVRRLEERAAALAGSAEILATRQVELEGCNEKLAGRDLTKAATEYRQLGVKWAATIDRELHAVDRKAQDLQAQGFDEERAIAKLEAEVGAARAEHARLTQELGAATQALGGAPEAVQTSLEADIEAYDRKRAQAAESIRALEQEANEAEARAKAALEAAVAHADRQTATVGELAARMGSAREARDRARGELGVLRAQSEQDRAEDAERRLRSLKAALAELPAPSPPASDQEVLEAEESSTRRAEELRHKESELVAAQAQLEVQQGTVAREKQVELELALAREIDAFAALEVEAESWKLLRDTLVEAEARGEQHLGKALVGSVTQNLVELTAGRYPSVELGPHLETEGISAGGYLRSVNYLSAGTRDQLATMLRLALATSLGSTIVLDDQLIQSDPDRLRWFRGALAKAAETTQIIVLTCRKADYEAFDPQVADQVRYVDLEQKLKHFGAPRPSAVPPRPSAPPAVDRSAAVVLRGGER